MKNSNYKHYGDQYRHEQRVKSILKVHNQYFIGQSSVDQQEYSEKIPEIAKIEDLKNATLPLYLLGVEEREKMMKKIKEYSIIEEELPEINLNDLPNDLEQREEYLRDLRKRFKKRKIIGKSFLKNIYR